MRHYRTQKIEIKKLDEIICNCCGKKISVINEVPQEEIAGSGEALGVFFRRKTDRQTRLICVRPAMTGSDGFLNPIERQIEPKRCNRSKSKIC